MKIDIKEKWCYRERILIALGTMITIYISLATIITIITILPKEHFKTNTFYMGVILIVTILAKLAQMSKKKYVFNLFFIASFCLLFFLIGFRNFSGIDDRVYMKIFNDVEYMGWINKFILSGIEPGYLLLNKIVGIFTNNYFYMQLVSSFISIFLFYNAFNKNKKNLNLSMAIFLFCTTISFQMLSAALIRMFIALGIITNAYYELSLKKYKKFYYMVIVAASFHYSALFVLILSYFIINESNLKRSKIKFIFLCVILIPVIFIIISFIAPLMGERYEGYGTINKLKLSIGMFDTLPIIMLLIIYKENIIKRINEGNLNLYIVIFSLSSIISVYSSILPIGRLIYYSTIGLILGAANISKKVKGKMSGIIFNGIIFFYGFVYISWTQFMLEGYIGNLYPYQNIFFNI